MPKNILAKISLFFLILSFGSCNIYRKIPNGSYLLKDNVILADSTKVKSDEVHSLLLQQPNVSIFGYPILADIYTFADLHPDKTFYDWTVHNPLAFKLLERMFSRKQIIQLQLYYKDVNKFIKEFGEPPVFIDSLKAEKSIKRLRYYYVNKGFLDVKDSFNIKKVNRFKANIVYNIEKKRPYIIHKYDREITSKYLKKLFNENLNDTKIKTGKNYQRIDFENEKSRITNLFRNNGVYHFQPSYVNFDLVFDSLQNKRNIDAHLVIPNRTVIKGDSVLTKEFIPYTIKNIDLIITKDKKFDLKHKLDSIYLDGIHIYALNSKIKYRPKVLTNSVLIRKSQLYSDLNRSRTHRLLMNLKNFKQVYIQYDENEKDSTLSAKIYLIPEKQFGVKTSLDVTHSNIHNLGIKGGLEFTAKNLFRGAEVLNLSSYLMTASSRTIRSPGEKFFDVGEFGTSLTLNFPRILIPFGINKYIPKYMSPRTFLSFSANKQDNIGLDRLKYAGKFGYEWKPIKQRKYKIDFFNLEFITNKKNENYFKIYNLSFNRLVTAASNLGDTVTLDNADSYLENHYNDSPELKIIHERKQRITQDIFIISNRFDFYYDSRNHILQQKFYLFNTTFEFAGSVLKPIANALNFPKNDENQYTINGVPFAEYAKMDVSFVKHWQLHKQHILAYRAFFGIALPYGNSKSIPLTSSYFGGGSNDIRAWRAYTLGPGTTGGPNEFNQANLKFTTNIEYRFPIAGYFKGALFADAGNIWNVDNKEIDEASSFKGFSSLRDMALGTGVGLRVDFTYFIIRFDLAFKTYDPSRSLHDRWLLKKIALKNSVLNLGISYPF